MQEPPDIGDPDWGRFGIKPPDAFLKVGDPTRWGTTILQPVPFTSVGPHRLVTEQSIQIACRDGYARNWSIVGTVGANSNLWSFTDGLGVVGAGPLTWSCYISVRMGVAMNTIVHNINLRATIDADAPFYIDSPTAIAEAPPIPPSAVNRQYTSRVRPFVVPGSVCANQISVQIVNIVEYALPPLPDGDAVQVAIQLAPIAAATGL